MSAYRNEEKLNDKAASAARQATLRAFLSTPAVDATNDRRKGEQDGFARETVILGDVVVSIETRVYVTKRIEV